MATRSKFVIRATTPNGVSDKTFYIDVEGADNPTWTTASGYLPVGYNGEGYAFDGQYIDFTLEATAQVLPPGYKMHYYIEDNDGTLPRGITLTEDGRIYGFIRENLTFDANAAADGGYDDEKYDAYSYDHGIQGSSNLNIKSVPRIYRFYVTASDGVSQSKRLFKMAIVSGDMFRTNNSLLDLGFEIFTVNNIPADVGYLQPIQFLQDANLGTLRSSNETVLNVSGYDPFPWRGPVVYSLSTGTSLPVGLSLDPETGFITGYVPYQPAYTTSYNLTINATKLDNESGKTITSFKEFSLKVKGEVESSISWVTSADLGILYTGRVSELSIKAKHTNSDYAIKYNIINGSLPAGISLGRDGSLSGRADYNSTGTYTFTVLASDVYELSAIEREFTLNVAQYNNKKYTQIYCKPFITRDKRIEYQNFISDDTIFDPKLIYRYFDPNFGIQSDIKINLEFGIEQLNLDDIVPAMQTNFYRRKFYFGDVKLAIAKDDSGNIIYEVIYVDIVDNLVNNSGKSISNVIYINDKPYYPGSIDNMRRNLELLTLPDYSYVSVDEYFLPRFMRTAQSGEYRQPGYMKVLPLCYAIPGQGSKIIRKIKESTFDFKLINFTIDRIVVQDSLDNTSAKYLLIERQTIVKNIEVLGDTLSGEDWLTYPGGFTLPMEPNKHVTRE